MQVTKKKTAVSSLGLRRERTIHPSVSEGGNRQTSAMDFYLQNQFATPNH
jgi:hypothetical protein